MKLKRVVLILFTIAVSNISYVHAQNFSRDLYIGIRNDAEVVRLQEFLRTKGFFTYPESTGNYFSATQSAVAAFQKSNNISPAIGYTGPLTRAEINRQLSGTASSPPPTTTPVPPFMEFSRTLTSGLTDDADVIRLQEFLRATGHFTYPFSTGNYFVLTEEAVYKYQETNNLPVNGRFDGRTLREVNEAIRDRVVIVDNTTVRMPPTTEIATSTFYKTITLSQFRGNSTNPLSEQITISNTSKNESINITGWTITNARNNRIIIPQIQNLPGQTTIQLNDLILEPRGTVIITVGKQDRNMNFRENLCTGYFKETSKFTPSLSSRCPSIDTKDFTQFSDKCLAVLQKNRGCSIPDSADFFGIENNCTEFLVQNYSYAGCVRNYKTRTDFYQNRWLIWLQRDTELFRNTHETITLRDRDGKFVDERGY